jgi:hypothetical protein
MIAAPEIESRWRLDSGNKFRSFQCEYPQRYSPVSLVRAVQTICPVAAIFLKFPQRQRFTKG